MPDLKAKMYKLTGGQKTFSYILQKDNAKKLFFVNIFFRGYV